MLASWETNSLGNHPAELIQLDRSRLRRNCMFVIMRNIPVLCRLFRLPLPVLLPDLLMDL